MSKKHDAPGKGRPHSEGPQAEVHDIAQTINQQVVQSLTQSNDISGLVLNVDADGKSKVDFKHTDVSIKIIADQTNDADQTVDQSANNAVTVETTVVSGKGANATTSTVSQTIDQNVEQVLNQANNITGVDIQIEASDKSKVSFKHSDFNVFIKADQTNEANQEAGQTGGNTFDADSFRWHNVSTDVDQEIIQASTQEIDQSNTINGVILSVDAEDKAKVDFHHSDFNVAIIADQENYANQSSTLTASNDVLL